MTKVSLALLGATLLVACVTPPPPATTADSGEKKNWALGQAADADSAEEKNPAQAGNDGDFGTRWCAIDGEYPVSYTVDFGRPVALKSSVVTWEFDGHYSYRILSSPDKTQWAVVVDQSLDGKWGSETRDALAGMGRYWKIEVTDGERRLGETETTWCWASFYEWELYE